LDTGSFGFVIPCEPLMRYRIYYGEIAQFEGTQIDRELDQLAAWLRSSGIDPDFVRDDHLYCVSDGEYWIHLPELTERQRFAMQLIVSSGELLE
jgi:hypothetical protein